ncbi:hypothetical protein [Nocardia sp. NPDC056100]|uniref:hypothetical protein n=1 Tax=Nocardia sp. NPDC056100 TaxID=3345712 RepID=UPI0035DDA416
MTVDQHAPQRYSLPPSDRARIAGRCGAVLAVGSAGLHAAGSSGHGSVAAPGVVLLNLMILACLVCAWHLWTRPTIRAWALTAAMSAGMIVLHTMPMGTAMHHTEMPMLRAATGTAVLEIAVAAAVLITRTVVTPCARSR